MKSCTRNPIRVVIRIEYTAIYTRRWVFTITETDFFSLDVASSRIIFVTHHIALESPAKYVLVSFGFVVVVVVAQLLTDAVCFDVAWRITGLTAISVFLVCFRTQFPIVNYTDTRCKHGFADSRCIEWAAVAARKSIALSHWLKMLGCTVRIFSVYTPIDNHIWLKVISVG